MQIVNEDGLPVIYAGSYKFKDKENRNIKIFNLKEMSEFMGFKVEDFVVKKSKKSNNEMLFGAVVPKKKIEEIKKEMDKKIKKVKKEGKIIVPSQEIVGADGKPIKKIK